MRSDHRDDGLQHYRLARDVELALIDERGVMNGWCLPAGPLREPVSRLAQVDALVLNGTAVSPAPTFSNATGRFSMRLAGNRFHRLDDPRIECGAADLAGLNCMRWPASVRRSAFSITCARWDWTFVEHAFPDHHDYPQEELAFAGDAILTTEKDAVKLARLSLSLPVWVLPVTAEVSPDLAAFVLEKLNGRPPA
jgi:tetraacyldisaccharide 4'-kinase